MPRAKPLYMVGQIDICTTPDAAIAQKEEREEAGEKGLSIYEVRSPVEMIPVVTLRKADG